MSQFITIQVGQCGNQIGSAFWPSALEEYGIQCTAKDSKPTHGKSHMHLSTSGFQSFFSIPTTQEVNFKTLSDLRSSKVKARAICVDMEDSVVDQYRCGPLSWLFDRKCLITNYPGSGNNWAEGHFTHGQCYRQDISNSVRQMVEQCDQLHGFLMLFSLGGGTGSGLGTAILEMLSDEFPNIDRFVSCVYPVNMDDVITSPYNVALATKELSNNATCVFPVENKALFDICDRVYLNNKLAVGDAASFGNVNSLIVDMLLHLTSASRFPGQINVDMNEIATNMIPYPKLQYILSGMSPLGSQPKISKKLKYEELLVEVLSHTNQLFKRNTQAGLICGAAFLARGQFNLVELRNGVDRYRCKAKTALWNNSPVKVGLCSVPSQKFDRSLLGLYNTTSVRYLFEDVLTNFNKLFRRKAHAHHYTRVDQFEESCFIDCKENLIETIVKYKEIENCTPVDTHRLVVI